MNWKIEIVSARTKEWVNWTLEEVGTLSQALNIVDKAKKEGFTNRFRISELQE